MRKLPGGERGVKEGDGREREEVERGMDGRRDGERDRWIASWMDGGLEGWKDERSVDRNQTL